jgi:hypothetical protein
MCYNISKNACHNERKINAYLYWALSLPSGAQRVLDEFTSNRFHRVRPRFQFEMTMQGMFKRKANVRTDSFTGFAS